MCEKHQAVDLHFIRTITLLWVQPNNDRRSFAYCGNLYENYKNMVLCHLDTTGESCELLKAINSICLNH